MLLPKHTSFTTAEYPRFFSNTGFCTPYLTHPTILLSRSCPAPQLLLAMWLSWVRALHTADGTLRLSRPLLRAIEEWAGKESEAEVGRRWDKGQWIPTLPGMQQQQSPAVGGDGEAGDDSETDTASAGVEVKPDFTREVVRAEDETSPTGGEARQGENEGQQRTGSGTAAVATVSGRAPASDLEAEAMMLKAEREEREKVLELVGKLVADFGRFPPAEEEWEEVKDDPEKDDHEPSQGNERGTAIDQGCEGACNSVNDGDIRGGAENKSGKRDQPPVIGGPSGVGDGGETPRPEKARDDGGDCTTSGSDALETSLLASTRKALALKVEGNESYGKGGLEEARGKYTAALGILDAAAGASPPRMPLKSKTSVKKLEQVSRTEADALRGVLHRNRAAVALRLFESKATAAAAARDGKVPAAGQKGSTEGGIDAPNTGSGDRPQASSVTEPAPGGWNRGTSPGKGAGREAKEVGSTRLALESSLALLEECKSDCLKAIEVDAGDTKARLRLERCRDLRRRCYRGGLVAAAAGREGSSTGYSRQDERCGIYHRCRYVCSIYSFSDFSV